MSLLMEGTDEFNLGMGLWESPASETIEDPLGAITHPDHATPLVPVKFIDLAPVSTTRLRFLRLRALEEDD